MNNASGYVSRLHAYRHKMQIAIREGTCTDDEKRHYLFKYSFKPAGYGNSGGRFQLKRFVEGMERNGGFFCSRCGQPEQGGYDLATMGKMNSLECCFSCTIWDERRASLSNKNIAIVDGNMWSAKPAVNPNSGGNSSFRGCGGSPVRFKPIVEGRPEIITNDAWHGGSLPTHVHVEFADTHTSECMMPQEYADAYFSTDESRNKLAAQVCRHHPKMDYDEAKFHLSYHFWDPKRVVKHLAYPDGHRFRHIKEYQPDEQS